MTEMAHTPAVIELTQSDALRKRAHAVIPAGCHTYSKGDDQFPLLSPGFIARGQGCQVWDVDGNEFLDWGMGLRSVILGHAFEPVVEVVREYLGRGSNFTRPSAIETELAELLSSIIPCAEMVKFAKNGSDATTAAVKLARAYTGRDIVVRCVDHPFFSIDDWFIGDTACNAGVPAATKNLTKRFHYNDLPSLERVLDAHAGQVACVILEAAATMEPATGFLERVRELATRHGAVLIFDEMITGFRWHPRGAQSLYGVTPDLATFGKAMANGFSVAALAGRRELMELGGLKHSHPRVFLLSTTNGGETHELAAALQTIKILQGGDVTPHVWKAGSDLRDGFNEISDRLGLRTRIFMAGPGCSPYQVFLDDTGAVDYRLRTLYLQEMVKRGVLIPYIAPSFSHAPADVERTLNATSQSLNVVRIAVERGTVDGLLEGPAVKPVFRQYN